MEHVWTKADSHITWINVLLISVCHQGTYKYGLTYLIRLLNELCQSFFFGTIRIDIFSKKRDKDNILKEYESREHFLQYLSRVWGRQMIMSHAVRKRSLKINSHPQIKICNRYWACYMKNTVLNINELKTSNEAFETTGWEEIDQVATEIGFIYGLNKHGFYIPASPNGNSWNAWSQFFFTT